MTDPIESADQTKSSEADLTKSSEFEALKFLMDCSFKEAGLFWRRNAVLLAANLASFGVTFAYFSSAEEAISLASRALVGSFGVFLCIVWAMTTRAGRYMNHVWVSEAKKVAARVGHDELGNAVGGTPSDGVSKAPAMSATKLMYLLAIGFACAWMMVSAMGPGGAFYPAVGGKSGQTKSTIDKVDDAAEQGSESGDEVQGE